MSSTGTVTITAKVQDADKAKADIKSIRVSMIETSNEAAKGHKIASDAAKSHSGALTKLSEIAKGAAAPFNQLGDAAKGFGEKVSHGMESAKGMASGFFKDFISGVGKLIPQLVLAELAIKAVKAVLDALPQAFDAGSKKMDLVAETAQKMAAVFHGDKQAMEEMIAQSEKLDGASKFFDQEQFVRAQSTLRLHHLQKDAIKELVPVMADMAVVMGQDVTQAADSIGLAFEGSTRGLRQYGIQVQEGATKQEILNAIMAKAEQFHKAAEVAAGGNKAALELLKKAQDDLNTETAEFFIPLQIWGRQVMTDLTVATTKTLKTFKAFGELVKWVALDTRQAVADMLEAGAKLPLLGGKLHEAAQAIGTGKTREQLLDEADVKARDYMLGSPTSRAMRGIKDAAGVDGARDKDDPGKIDKAAAAAADKIADINQRLKDELKKQTLERWDFERYQARLAYDDAIKQGADRALAHQVMEKTLTKISKDEAEERSRIAKEALDADTKHLLEKAKKYGADNVSGPFTPEQGKAIGEIELQQAEKMNKEWARINKEVAEYVKKREEAAKKAEEELQKTTAEGIKKGLDVAKSLFAGDFASMASKAQGLLEEGVVSALSKSPAVQDAIGKLGSALSGPAGIALAFGAILTSTIIGAADKARKEAEGLRQHIADLESKYGPPKTKQNQIIDDWNKDEVRKKLYQEKGGLEAAIKQEEAKYAKISDKNSLEAKGEKGLIDTLYNKLYKADLGISQIDERYKSAIKMADAEETAATKAREMADAMERNARTAAMLENAQAGLVDAQLRNDLATGKISQEDYNQQAAYNSAEAQTQRTIKEVTDEMLGGRTDRASKAGVSISISETIEALKANPNLRFEDSMMSDPKLFELLVTALKTEGLNKNTADVERNRVTPGSSPQTPMYTSIVNIKDFRDAFPASAAYRAAGAGTARKDGPPVAGGNVSPGKSS